ncbi:MAG: pyridoxal phosphate-dependent aminotransferase [Lachnospiraceae bacterium]|nr:pyridoxal phosphate-dependent aminotransferase [Lachnospiraceae bacterium]
MAERNLDFDKVIERKNTDCLKYDFAEKRGMPKDVLSFWVADMDFKVSSYIEDALIERAQHGIFGYSEVQTPYFETVRDWMKKYHNWEPQEKWLVKTPGIVFALAMAVKAYTEKGDGVLVQLPVYYPFSEVIEDNGRRVVSNTLYLGEDNRYHIDFEDFERKIKKEKIKLFFLCSPHNPVGRVWTREELITLGDICVKNNVIVVSDEIHHDFIWKGEHEVFANIKSEYEEISITCTSPSKTFNIAGMQISNIFIPNSTLRRKFQRELNAAGTSQMGVMGLVACEAAYKKGEEWYQAMCAYVKDNFAFVKQFVEEQLPGVTMIDSEGTYLVWLDFRGTGLSADELDRRIIYEAKLWLDSGKIFGDSGKGFQRINVACPRSILKEGMERIRNILK